MKKAHEDGDHQYCNVTWCKFVKENHTSILPPSPSVFMTFDGPNNLPSSDVNEAKPSPDIDGSENDKKNLKLIKKITHMINRVLQDAAFKTIYSFPTL